MARDECVAAPLVGLLRAHGHDVLYIAEAEPGLSDLNVIALALRDKRLLLTEDKDFGDLVFRKERTIPGVVLMRISSEASATKTSRFEATIARYGDGLFGRYTVVEEGRSRSRHLWSDR